MAFSIVHWLLPAAALVSLSMAGYHRALVSPSNQHPLSPSDQIREETRVRESWRWTSPSGRSLDIPPPEGEFSARDWLPIYETRTPYDEDEIVSLFYEHAQIYMKLASVNPETVAWAPEGGHKINETLCRELGMGPRVISLLRRLIYSNNRGDGIHYDAWMSSLNYRDDNDIIASRYATGILPDLPEDQIKIQPQDVILAWGDREVDNMILDTEESKSLVFAYHLLQKLDEESLVKKEITV